MSWLRWWTGTVNDPKWRIIAARANCRPGDCVAVWAYMLEVAKDGEGDVTDADAEECAVILGYEQETVEAILAAMRDKGLIEGVRVKAWDKRQPKREDDSRARVAAFRERKSAEKSVTNQRDDARNDHVTHCNAPESESETDISSLRSDMARAPAPPRKAKAGPEGEALLLAEGVTESAIADWKAVRKAKSAGPITRIAAEAMIREAGKAKIPTADAVRIAAERGWQSFRADWEGATEARARGQPPPIRELRGSAAVSAELDRIFANGTQ